jgi:hypothetical protein
MDPDRCCKCGKLLVEGEPYAVLWGPRDRPASILGFVCLPCSEKYADITKEVTGE